MSSTIKTFNNQIYNLVTTMSRRFPNDKDIKLAQNKALRIIYKED